MVLSPFDSLLTTEKRKDTRQELIAMASRIPRRIIVDSYI